MAKLQRNFDGKMVNFGTIPHFEIDPEVKKERLGAYEAKKCSIKGCGGRPIYRWGSHAWCRDHRSEAVSACSVGVESYAAKIARIIRADGHDTVVVNIRNVDKGLAKILNHARYGVTSEVI